MTSSSMYKENRDNGGRTSLPQMVIEVEGLGESETRLGLIVDTHLVAKNLTTAQMKFLGACPDSCWREWWNEG